MTLSERSARLALACTADAGDPGLSELVVTDGGQATWAAVRAGGHGEGLGRRAAALDLATVVAATAECESRFVIPGDEEWPEQLDALRYCDDVQRRGGIPFGLWLRGPGHLAAMTEHSVAVVGARACTPYGSGVATDLAAELGERGVTVISGGAYGIDVAAHRGALAVRGATVAVLANGLDIAYPRGNAAMLERVADEGLLVSELPPGATPTRVRFLARNRLIAALAVGTVVVEAAIRSGARNTASWAVGCHRLLMAVPGPVHSAQSEAPHLMIRNGQACLVTGAPDVLELISPAGRFTVDPPHGPTRVTDHLDPTRLAVFEAVPARRRASAGDIALTAGVSMPVVLAQLAELEAAGLVEGSDAGWRVLVGASSGSGSGGTERTGQLKG